MRRALRLVVCLCPVLGLADEANGPVDDAAVLVQSGALKLQEASEEFLESGERAAQEALEEYFVSPFPLLEEVKERLHGFSDESNGPWKPVEEKIIQQTQEVTQQLNERQESQIDEAPAGPSRLMAEVQSLWSRFGEWSALPDNEKELLKVSEQQALELLRTEAGSVKSKAPVVGPLVDKLKFRLAARKALSGMVAHTREQNPSIKKGESFNEVRNYVKEFTAEKSAAQKRLQKLLLVNFDWEDKDKVLAAMKEWRAATKSILPKERREVEDPNCLEEPIDQGEKNALKKRIATADGEPNLRAWCYLQEEMTMRTNKAGKPFADAVLKTCVLDSNPALSAVLAYDVQKSAGNDEIEASYCFLEGHCFNAALDEYSSQDEGQQVCDMRYGHKAWTSVGFDKDLERSLLVSGSVSAADGIRSKQASAHLGKVACAMGSYHCDVALCKKKYCHVQHYKEKYESLYGATEA